MIEKAILVRILPLRVISYLDYKPYAPNKDTM